MGRIITIVNQKGGVGKTTTAINLSHSLAEAGKKVLLIDTDPQANATSGLGIDMAKLEKGIYEALINKHPIHEVVFSTPIENVHIIPATTNLAGAVVELVSVPEREYLLLKNIDKIKDAYDFVIVDCPPSLGLLTVNSIVAGREILIPVQCEYYALEGLGQLLNTINLVKQHLNPDIKVLGAVMTMFDKRNKLSDEILRELYQHFPHYVFRSVIPRNVKLAEAPSYGQSILQYDKHSKGAKAYRKLAQEILYLEKN
ncbi:MAG: AAA family ATPase [Patescibacteria group bacterium]|jgi:chromosome partitioning protein